MDDDIYITVELSEYCRLLDLKDFLQDLFDAGLENWEGFEEIANAFVADSGFDPREDM